VTGRHDLLRDRRDVRGVEENPLVDDREIAADSERIIGASEGLRWHRDRRVGARDGGGGQRRGGSDERASIERHAISWTTLGSVGRTPYTNKQQSAGHAKRYTAVVAEPEPDQVAATDLTETGEDEQGDGSRYHCVGPWTIHHSETRTSRPWSGQSEAVTGLRPEPKAVAELGAVVWAANQNEAKTSAGHYFLSLK
jgi:hypothetical protein